MRKLKLTDPDTNAVYHGQLPEGWHEVRVSMFQQFARLQASRRPELSRLSALQALTNLPAEVLEADASLAPALAALYLPWFFAGLPSGEPAPTLQHRGTTYEYVGDWGKLSTGQFEALLTFLDEAKGNPGLAAPHLLAVLLVAKGRTQDGAAVAAAAEAFATLSMEQAWPYVGDFLKHSCVAAARTSAYGLAKSQTETALQLLEQNLSSLPKPAGALPRLYSGIAGALVRRYVRSARGRLRNS